MCMCAFLAIALCPSCCHLPSTAVEYLPGNSQSLAAWLQGHALIECCKQPPDGRHDVHGSGSDATGQPPAPQTPETPRMPAQHSTAQHGTGSPWAASTAAHELGLPGLAAEAAICAGAAGQPSCPPVGKVACVSQYITGRVKAEYMPLVRHSSYQLRYMTRRFSAGLPWPRMMRMVLPMLRTILAKKLTSAPTVHCA